MTFSALGQWVRRAWWWLQGLIVCYAMHKDGDAFCKRRSGHFGKHSTAGGFKWPK